MATPQVFIVNETTFPLHLQYRFAGTTAGLKVEKHIGLLADISRVRPGDPFFFYVEGQGFYGIFQITDDYEYPYWEKLNGWLQAELSMPLIYRVPIEPFEVYKRPVTEWEAIDKLPLYSRDIRWSLLYRKLKGKRGCSYLLPYEYESLKKLLKSANPEGPIAGPNEADELTWEHQEIQVKKGIPRRTYKGSLTSPFDYIDLRKSETHLQAWFVWHIGKASHIQPICGNPTWFANEVFAGAGMQKMDLLCIISFNFKKEFRVIELKADRSTPENLEQLRRYIWWIKDYIWKEGDGIQPIWVCKGFEELSKAKDRAKKITEEEQCKEPQIWRWELRGNQPSFIFER